MSNLPLFPTATVGSWPRTPAVLRALREHRQGRIADDAFTTIADAACLEALAAQERSGIDIVTDGEQRRDNFYSFVAGALDGVAMLSLADLLDHVEDKASFEEILGTLDAPASMIMNPTATGPISRRRPLALEEYRFLRRHTDRPVKIPLPGPYLLTRAMWVEGLSGGAYPTKEHLAEDVVRVLRAEVQELAAEGVAFIQLDEPVLTELAFSRRRNARTFMCAALATRGDPKEELDFAVDLINAVVDGVRGVRTGVHVCRGNWSTREEVLLSGDYEAIMPWLARLRVDQLVLEYATPRAGALTPLATLTHHEVGLGVVNPRTDAEDSPAPIRSRVEDALGVLPPARIFLNPDCGFGTFSRRPMNTAETAEQKLGAMVAAARSLREAHADAPTPAGTPATN
ncbi:MAG: vitamin-B12 independent methionine synthase [Dehalococcoidia bacterium]